MRFCYNFRRGCVMIYFSVFQNPSLFYPGRGYHCSLLIYTLPPAKTPTISPEWHAPRPALQQVLLWCPGPARSTISPDPVPRPCPIDYFAGPTSRPSPDGDGCSSSIAIFCCTLLYIAICCRISLYKVLYWHILLYIAIYCLCYVARHCYILLYIAIYFYML